MTSHKQFVVFPNTEERSFTFVEPDAFCEAELQAISRFTIIKTLIIKILGFTT
jgi:hypothetical protein